MIRFISIILISTIISCGSHIDQTIKKTSNTSLENAYTPPKLIITEVMWQGSFSNTGKSYPEDEFIEIYNEEDYEVDISLFKIKGITQNKDIPLVIPAGSKIPPKGVFVITHSLSAYLYSNLTDDSLNIPNDGFKIELYDQKGNLIDKIECESKPCAGVNDYDKRIRISMKRDIKTLKWENTKVQKNIDKLFIENTFASPGYLEK